MSVYHKAGLDQDQIRALAGLTLGGGLGYMFGPRRNRLLAGLTGAGLGAGAGYLLTGLAPTSATAGAGAGSLIKELAMYKAGDYLAGKAWSVIKKRMAASAAKKAAGTAVRTAAGATSRSGAGRLLGSAGTRLGPLGTGTAAAPAVVIMAALQAAKGVLDPDRSLQAVRNLDPSSENFRITNLWRAVDPRNVGAALQMGFEAGVRPLASVGQNYLTKLQMDARSANRAARGR